MTTAPDGGPARRRATGEDLQLAEQLATVQDAQRSLAADVAEIGGTLTTSRDETAQLAGDVADLSKRISDLLGDPASDPATVDWWTLDREQAATAWSGLWSWLSTYYLPRYLPTREELPDCWPRHSGMRDELSWLWCAHRAAYAPQAVVGTAAQWHSMWRSSAFTQVAGLARRLECAPGRCTGAATGPLPEDNELSTPEHWFSDAIQHDLDQRPVPTE